MSKEAIKYLRGNKDKYPREQLVSALVGNGYSGKDIEESLREVYGDSGGTKMERGNFDFLDFKNVGKYSLRKEKVIDFLFGFFFPIIFIVTFSLVVPFLGFFLSLILVLVFAFFVFKRRRWIFYGLATWFLTSIIIILIILFIIFNSLRLF